LLAALLLASGAALVPASAEAALVVDGGAPGIRALFTTASTHTSSLSPDAIGRSLSRAIGVDLLAEQPGWSLRPRGPRVVITAQGSIALSAPVANAKAARSALSAWLGPVTRPARPKPLKGPLVAGNRAGMVAPVGGSLRLLTASGPHAAALVSALAHPSAFSKDKALLARATGPAWLYLAGRPPLRAAIFQLDASASGLVANGLVTSLRDAILADGAPAPCDGAPPGCLRAGLGPAGRELLSLAFARLGKPLPEGLSISARLDGIALDKLSDERSLPSALRISAAAAETQPGPALAGQLDLGQIDLALSRLSPIDALRGSLAAGAYATHLLYGPLLRNAGPLTVTGVPSGNSATVELRLPLR